MPTILKQKTDQSPGIITFTQNEALWGLPANSKKVNKFVNETAARNEWIYGVHVQGNLSFLDNWPLQPWHGFIMWPSKSAGFLSNIPENKHIAMNCINFMPDAKSIKSMDANKSIWDIVVISRASKIKRIYETLDIVRRLFLFKPNLKVVFIVPDHRECAKGRRRYKKYGVDPRYFELPMQYFSSTQLKNITFISSSTESFGMFPLDVDIINFLIISSRFLLLTSHKEGTPRVIAETLMAGVPCIVSKNLESPITNYLNGQNSLFIDDDTETAARQIWDALNRYSQFSVDAKSFEKQFSASINVNVLKDYLSQLIKVEGKPVEGEWYLDDLHLRLACHGQKHNYQFMYNEALFFSWLDNVQKFNPYDEDSILGKEPIKDKLPFFIKNIFPFKKWKIK